MALPIEFARTRLAADPEGKFVHAAVLESCHRHAGKVAIIDTSCIPSRRITYAAYGEMVELAALGLVAAGIRPGERIGIYLPNCWEFAVAYHAATLAGAIPTTMNPTYRDREVHYQLETTEAAALISDGTLLTGINLGGLPALRKVYTIRAPGPSGSEMFDTLLRHEGQRQRARAGTRLAADAGDASLLQWYDRPAQGRDAIAPQPGGQCLPDADAWESTARSRKTRSCFASCRSITFTVSR